MILEARDLQAKIMYEGKTAQWKRIVCYDALRLETRQKFQSKVLADTQSPLQELWLNNSFITSRACSCPFRKKSKLFILGQIQVYIYQVLLSFYGEIHLIFLPKLCNHLGVW